LNKNIKKHKVISLGLVTLILFSTLVFTFPLGKFLYLNISRDTSIEELLSIPQQSAPNLAPYASFRVYPNILKAGGEIACYALTSYDLDGYIESYLWDFGDGNTDSGSHVYHQYQAIGEYVVILTVIDNVGLTDSCSQSVSVKPSGLPEPVDNSPINWEDGTTEGFTSSGESGITATLTNDMTEAYSGSNSLRCDVTAQNAGTIDVRFDSSLPLISPGSTVFFHIWVPSGVDLEFVQPYMMPHSSDWSQVQWFGGWTDYGGLTKDQWTEISVSIASDMDPTWAQQIGIQISINAPLNFSFYMDSIDWYGPSIPRASFDYSSKRPNTGEIVTFDAVNSLNDFLKSYDPDGEITSYEWDFGDGTISSGSIQTHSYVASGKYPVTLTVTDKDGNIHSLSRIVWCGISEQSFVNPLQIQGNQLLDAEGRLFVPKGLAITDSLSFIEENFDYLKHEFRCNMLRFPLIIDRWYYVSETERETYLATFEDYLQWAYDRGMYVSFDPWHEGGVGPGELEQFEDIKDAFHIISQRFGGWSHLIWEITNEPHTTDWVTWAPMAEEIIDIIRSYNPASTACVVPGVNWAQTFDLRNRPINRPNVGYSVHPYPQAYKVGDTWTYESWDEHFGYIVNEGYGPVINTEWSYPLFDTGDRTYGELLMSYMEEKNIGFLGWIFGDDWGSIKSDPNVKGSDWGQLMWEYLNGVWVPNAVPPDFPLGDVNHDNNVDIVDALLVAQYVVGLPSPIYQEQADVNLDGVINIVDALLIAQYYVGVIPTLPPPPPP